MNRSGLIVALVIATIVGLAFGFYPQLDVTISAKFYTWMIGDNNFAARIYPPLMMARDAGLWVTTLLIAPVVAALIIKLILPRASC
ncbi:MAG: hypothetical protein WDN48_07265 [Pseudolabrys sp.]